MSRYDDIIDLPHHVSPTRQRMSMRERAAQFAPFSALVGYGEAVAETARETELRPEQDEQELRELNAALCRLAERITEKPFIRIRYFIPDERKSGGRTAEICGKAEKLSVSGRKLFMPDGTVIAFADIIALSVETDRDV